MIDSKQNPIQKETSWWALDHEKRLDKIEEMSLVVLIARSYEIKLLIQKLGPKNTYAKELQPTYQKNLKIIRSYDIPYDRVVQLFCEAVGVHRDTTYERFVQFCNMIGIYDIPHDITVQFCDAVGINIPHNDDFIVQFLEKLKQCCITDVAKKPSDVKDSLE